jgi:hypothetical protein
VLPTALVVTVKVRVVEPAETVIDAGTVAKLDPLERVTTKPPDGAFAERVTVQMEVAPPSTDDVLYETFVGI